MRAEKMRGFDAADLQRQAQDAQEQLFRLRFQMGMGQTEGLKKYRNLKRDRARMLTVLHEKAASGEVIPEPVAVKAPAKKKLGDKKLAAKKTKPVEKKTKPAEKNTKPAEKNTKLAAKTDSAGKKKLAEKKKTK